MYHSLKFSDYISKFNEIKKETQNYNNKKLKIAILRSFSCENIEPVLTTELYAEGYLSDIKIGGFNQFYQEVLDSNSFLIKYKPDFIIFFVRLEDFYPTIIENYFEEENNIDLHIDKIKNDIEKLVNLIIDKINIPIIFSNFSKPYFSPIGVYHGQSENGINNIIRKLNCVLCDFHTKYKDKFIILDSDEIISDIGRINVYDMKMWEIAKNPYKIDFYINSSKYIVKLINSIKNKRKKCIVLDLDNTLWKGIIGEDGIENIKIYKEFQRQLYYLYKSGILLAVNSKNNYNDANEAMNHPDMILKEENFAALRINWENKALNIVSISEELNIGLESIVFIDDNQSECELVKQMLPEVQVINFNYKNYMDIIKSINIDYINLTDEDRDKTEKYKQQKQRKNAMNEFNDLSSYLKSLNMTIYIKKADNITIPRIAQMCAKTNQFNLTTKRYSQDNIMELLKNNYIIYTLRLEDKFGDNGITGLAIIKPEENKWIIDSFLLSCRIMNRTVEYAFLGFIIKKAKENKVDYIIGKYIPTAKNEPAKDMYKKADFVIGEKEKWFFYTDKEFNSPEYKKIEEMD